MLQKKRESTSIIGSVDECDCKTSRSTERCSDELRHESHNSAGKQAASSNSQRNSPTPHCPSSCLSDSYCNESHDEPAPPEKPHCSTGCHGLNATTDCLSRRVVQQPSPTPKEIRPSSSHGSSTSQLHAAKTHRSCTPDKENLPLSRCTLNPKQPSGPGLLP